MNPFRILCVSIGLSALSVAGYAQSAYAELGAGFGGGAVSPVTAFHKDWSLGKKGRFLIGTGLRFTGFYGSNITLTSAPANLANKPESVDSLFAPAPNINALNLLVNLGYTITEKIQVGFNIDVIGFSFGPTGKPNFISNGKQTTVSASPTKVNILLIDNNDRGSLTSHFYIRYKFSDRFGLKLAYQHLFTELTTTTAVQTKPETNDRFRVKSNQIFVGVSYGF